MTVNFGDSTPAVHVPYDEDHNFSSHGYAAEGDYLVTVNVEQVNGTVGTTSFLSKFSMHRRILPP